MKSNATGYQNVNKHPTTTTKLNMLPSNVIKGDGYQQIQQVSHDLFWCIKKIKRAKMKYSERSK